MRVLILSVGGSCEPVVNAIKEYRPDYVYFLCSSGQRGSERAVDGPGDPCGDPRKFKCPSCGSEHSLGNPIGKSIALQAGLERNQYEKLLVQDPDDLNECYLKLSQLASSLASRFPEDCLIIANYTGGTKTMSVAMAIVGTMTGKWDLSLNKGTRLDLIKVASGTDVPIVIDKWGIFSRLQMESVRESLKRFDYSAADGILSAVSSKPLDKPLQDKIIRARQICKAFNLWDKFDHPNALNLLEKVGGGEFASYTVTLKKILERVRSANGYERVGDLLLNAQRRSSQQRYDDAVARIYRAVELFAQIRLKMKYEIDTSNLKLDQLPPHLREEYQARVKDDGRLLFGLREDYELLYKLHDPLGLVYDQRKEKVIDAIKRRNHSIYAHGLTPMAEEDYNKVWGTLNTFITELAKAINITLELPQLPREEILDRLELP